MGYYSIHTLLKTAADAFVKSQNKRCEANVAAILARLASGGDTFTVTFPTTAHKNNLQPPESL